jgi:hypothetical protein
MKVAVIGAGPAGLVSAREVILHGCEVVVFEAADQIGGVWVYNKSVEDDLLGQPPRQLIRCSLYDSLRTNIPRDLMAFLGYTFDSKGGGNDTWPRFPHHTKVLEYLRNFSDDYALAPHIRLSAEVHRIEKLVDGWTVYSGNSKERFDAVIVCNGHYARPRIPILPGIKYFKGQLLHSHNYRDPSAMTGKRVALWGTSASGFDLSGEIDKFAARTYWCGNAFNEPMPFGATRTVYPSPSGFTANGKLIVATEELDIDTFMYCTGYHYDFPFINDEIVSVDDNWVHPLYQDIVPPADKTLGFIGLPYLIVPFPMFEMQAKWFVKQLISEFTLHDAASRGENVRNRSDHLQSSGLKKRHYHRLGDQQFQYYNLLAQQCGQPPIPEWFKQTWSDAQRSREANPINFRDIDLPTRGPTICLFDQPRPQD